MLFGGRLWAGGETYAPDGAAIPMLVRLFRDGRIDPTFGTQGYARIAGIANARVIGVDVDGGRAIVGGASYAAGAPNKGFVARVERDASDGPPAEVPLGGGVAWLVLTLLVTFAASASVVSGSRK